MWDEWGRNEIAIGVDKDEEIKSEWLLIDEDERLWLKEKVDHKFPLSFIKIFRAKSFTRTSKLPSQATLILTRFSDSSREKS